VKKLEAEVALPVARKSTSELNGGNISLDEVEIPNGMYVSKVLVDAMVTTAGSAGTGTSKVADVLKDLEIRNEENVRVFHAQGGAGIGIIAFLCAAIAAIMGQVPRSAVFDEDVAGNDTYYGSWEISHGLRGRKFKVNASTYGASTLAGYSTAPTSLSVNLCVSFELSAQQPIPGKLSGIVKGTQTDYSADVIAALIGIETSQVHDVLDSLKWGNQNFNAAQIEMLENVTNLKLRGAGAAGSQKPVPGVLMPNTSNALNAVVLKAEDVKKLSLSCSSSTLLIGKIEPYTSED
jgi:hypothetical protein